MYLQVLLLTGHLCDNLIEQTVHNSGVRTLPKVITNVLSKVCNGRSVWRASEQATCRFKSRLDGQQRARADEMNLVGASMGAELCVCGAAEGQG